MSCACAKKNQTQSIQQRTFAQTTSDCNYDSNTTNSWIDLLECINEKNFLSQFGIQKALYNSFLGVLISIQRNPDTICTFKTSLDTIQPYILNIINSQICL